MGDTERMLIGSAVVGVISPVFWLVARATLLWGMRKIWRNADEWANVPLFVAASKLAPPYHWANQPIGALIRRLAGGAVRAVRAKTRRG